ncbi:transient receptor potential cation channel subfamily V member 6-like isoform X2 [Betta splendens]|uniref:Transient receptor potential cation channel subfamily V member 6-like isoform X2 n=1 Tax=Betta splendens TaxID=158456 RepID=A0A6P7N870_BETSP|nr:transient receptor potential cation channel subfamily V member 6-like isoform X2 [Betta splendens]
MSASSSFNCWWRQPKFCFQRKKSWNQTVDESFMFHTKTSNEIPLFYAALKNDVKGVRGFLQVSSTDVFERGAFGETSLHVAVMNDNLEAAVALMDAAPELVDEPMTSELFQGLTPLHIAVINQNLSLVQHLIDRGADVNTPRATGLYFQKRKGGLFFYGEHILSFAACTGNKDIVSLLIDAGASTRVQDHKGNTLLHVLVLQPNQETACRTFDLLMACDAECDPSLPLDKVLNVRGLTPFKLAAKKGNVAVFQHLVNRRRVFQCSLGPVTSNLYDLTEIDSWADNDSVLDVVVCSRHREARRILEVTPVKQLISLKWNLYGKHYFRMLLFVYLLYISIFTACCVLRPLKDIPADYPKPVTNYSFNTIYVQKSLNESYVTYGDHVRMGGEIISVVGAVAMILLEIPDILRVGAKRYFGQTALGGPFHVILIVYGGLVVLLCVFRLCQVQQEMSVMAVCLVLGWCNVLFFARGFEMLGPLVIVVQKMIFEDLLKFMWLLIIVDIGYATAVWTHYMTQTLMSIPDYTSLPVMFFSQFEVITTFINLPIDESILTPPVLYMIDVSLTVFGSILLLNVFVVMLNDTMSRVGQERDELWRTQVVATTLMMERRLPRRLLPRFGTSGLCIGPKNQWFLRIEHRKDQMEPKRNHCNKTSIERVEGNQLQPDSTSVTVMRKRSSKRLTQWKLLRHIILGFKGAQAKGHKD